MSFWVSTVEMLEVKRGEYTEDLSEYSELLGEYS